jgi:hypothetical protein
MPYAAFDPAARVVTNPTAADLGRLAGGIAPPSLTVMDYRLDSLAPLARLRGLEVLKIQGALAVRDLAPLSALATLRSLVMATPPGSDRSGRTIEVSSLAPLTALTALERLVLTGVRPLDGDLQVLGRMTHLRELDVSAPGFALEDFARLAAALPATAGRCLVPHFTIPGLGFCRTCKGQQVMLNAAPPRARKWLCPACQPKPLAAHVARWEAAKAAATASSR